MKDFNDDQRSFVESMGRGFKDQKPTSIAIEVGIAFVFFLLLIAIVYTVFKNWWSVRGFFIRRYRMWGKNQKFDERFAKKCEVLILKPSGLGDTHERSVTLNLSRTGMFVKMNPPLARNDQFRFYLHLDDEKIDGLAEVLWVQNKWSEHHPTGIGCHFINLGEAQRKILERYLKKK